jgi:nicotinamidase-related amidase
MSNRKQNNNKNDDTLLTPENHATLLIDHQYLQLLTLRSHDPSKVAKNASILAKSAKVFNVPTLFTTAFAERQALIKEVQNVLPDQKPIDRTGLNSWDDKRVVDWVKKTGRKNLVIAGLWTEVCLNLAVQSALADGYRVYIVTDASGGENTESHSMAVHRMIQSGAIPITVLAYLSELQRDWANEKTAPTVTKLFEEHGSEFGTGLQWEWQLLGLKAGTR